jgi:UDP:flavonoid glycosyltransferase YjiC (YdhE family)
MQTNNQTTGKKILIASAPADGHFNPLTGIAKHLEGIGYDVRWYASRHYAEKISKLKMIHYPFTIAKDFHASNLDEDFPERVKIKNPIKKINWDIVNFFVARGPEYLEDIKQIRKVFPFDLLICDNGFTGAVFVKDVLKIPVIAASILPLTETSKDLPPYGMGLTPSRTIIGRLKQKFLRWLSSNILFASSTKVMAKVLEAHGIQHNNLSVFDITPKKADLLLQSGTPSFEYYRSDLGENVRFVGPLLPYNEPSNKQSWFDQRLNKYKNIVLVTQGTVEKDVTKLLVPTLEALKEDTDTLIICTTGGSQTKQLKKQYDQFNIIIEDFIPFDDVMPYADVYISNGGYGGVLLGIKHNLPMVVAGVHEGKNEICARVGYFKYGINLKTEKPAPSQIRDAVNEVLTNPDFKANVVRLASEMESYDTYALFEGYVKAILSMQEHGHEIKILESTYLKS